MILLQDILPLAGLTNTGKILLIRHTHELLNEMVNKDLIEEFQSFQAKPAFTQCKYIASFIGGERNSAIFMAFLKSEKYYEKKNYQNIQTNLSDIV